MGEGEERCRVEPRTSTKRDELAAQRLPRQSRKKSLRGRGKRGTRSQEGQPHLVVAFVE